MSQSTISKFPWDKVGITLSGVCALHCLALPVLVSILPLWPVMAGFQHWIHPFFLVLIIPVVIVAIRRSHYDRTITITLLTGTVLIAAGWLAGHYLLGLWPEILLTFSGSLLLITGHWRNYRHHQVCKNAHHHHHPVAEEILSSDHSAEIVHDECHQVTKSTDV